jgi:hypothetical protein
MAIRICLRPIMPDQPALNIIYTTVHPYQLETMAYLPRPGAAVTRPSGKVTDGQSG